MLKGAYRIIASSRKRLQPFAARLGLRSRSGSAMIEFAFVAPIFFLFLMATFEVGIIFLGTFVLQNATNDAARLIRTGQISTTAGSTAFRDLICSKITPLLACDSKLQINVETVSSFGAATISNPVTSSGTLDASLNKFDPGTVCSVVLVRTFYTYTVATPMLTPFLVNINSSQHLLTAAAAFRNEPYTSAVSGC